MRVVVLIHLCAVRNDVGLYVCYVHRDLTITGQYAFNVTSTYTLQPPASLFLLFIYLFIHSFIYFFIYLLTVYLYTKYSNKKSRVRTVQQLFIYLLIYLFVLPALVA